MLTLVSSLSGTVNTQCELNKGIQGTDKSGKNFIYLQQQQ